MQKQNVMRELGEHLPFSVFFTAAGIALAALLTYGAIIAGLASPIQDHGHDGAGPNKVADGTAETAPNRAGNHEEESAQYSPVFIAAARMLFHIFHPIHPLLSA